MYNLFINNFQFAQCELSTTFKVQNFVFLVFAKISEVRSPYFWDYTIGGLQKVAFVQIVIIMNNYFIFDILMVILTENPFVI